jgi:hypothetical protein
MKHPLTPAAPFANPCIRTLDTELGSRCWTGETYASEFPQAVKCDTVQTAAVRLMSLWGKRYY